MPLWKTHKTIDIHGSFQNHETCITLGAIVQVFALLVFLEWWHLYHFESICPLCSDSSSHFFCNFVDWCYDRTACVSSKLHVLGMGWKTVPHQAKNSSYYAVLPDLYDSSIRFGWLLTQCGRRVSIKIRTERKSTVCSSDLFPTFVVSRFKHPNEYIGLCAYFGFTAPSALSYARSTFSELVPIGRENEMFSMFLITQGGGGWVSIQHISVMYNQDVCYNNTELSMLDWTPHHWRYRWQNWQYEIL